MRSWSTCLRILAILWGGLVYKVMKYTPANPFDSIQNTTEFNVWFSLVVQISDMSGIYLRQFFPLKSGFRMHWIWGHSYVATLRIVHKSQLPECYGIHNYVMQHKPKVTFLLANAKVWFKQGKIQGSRGALRAQLSPSPLPIWTLLGNMLKIIMNFGLSIVYMITNNAKPT